MKIEEQIAVYIESLSEPKRTEIQELHNRIVQLLPGTKLWFLDGKNDEEKIVSNPNIGYGSRVIKYANGDTKEFYQIGISANTTGISVYILGIDDKNYLSQTFGDRLGKASVSGYCIKFKTLKNIDITVLDEAIKFGITQ